jgi:hypothetical protein
MPAPLTGRDEQQPVAVPEQPDLCAQPEQLRNGRRSNTRWNKRHLTWSIINRLPHFTLEQQIAHTEWALDQYRIATNGWFSYERTDNRTTRHHPQDLQIEPTLLATCSSWAAPRPFRHAEN